MPDYSYQDVGVDWLRARAEDGGTAYLGDEPGLGKSRQLLLAAKEPILVIAPAMVLDGGTWDDETEKWAPGADVTQVGYSMLNARTRTEKGGSRPVLTLRPELDRHWGTVILDEAQYIKGRKTTWTVAARKLSSDRTFLASGTPIPNWAEELFTSLQLMHPAETKPNGELSSYWRWAKRWFHVNPTRYSPMAVGAPLDDSPSGWATFHDECFKGRFLQRLRDDVLTDLPPLTEQWLHLPMKPAQAKLYRELKKQYVAWTESGEEVSAWSAGGLHVKLAQTCTGLELVSGDRCSAKLDAFAERVRDQARPSLAVGHFRATVAAAAVRAAEVGRSVAVVDGGTSSTDRRTAIRAFQRGELDVLCATIETIGEGLTLTSADTVHMLERSYRPSKNQQVIRRVHRIGQTRPVTVVHYVSKATVDSGMLPTLAAKTDQQVKALRPAEYARLL